MLFRMLLFGRQDFSGAIGSDRQFKIVYETGPIAPQPWNQQIPETKGLACDWSNPKRGEKYKA
jgi:urea transport system substrate-binding protein